MAKIIKVNISENEVVNSLKIKELHEYLMKKGHDIISENNSQDGTKGDLTTYLTFAISLYPIIKDLFNYIRPKQQYSISVTNGITTLSKNNLTEEEYLKEIENLKGKNLEITINKE